MRQKHYFETLKYPFYTFLAFLLFFIIIIYYYLEPSL